MRHSQKPVWKALGVLTLFVVALCSLTSCKESVVQEELSSNVITEEVQPEVATTQYNLPSKEVVIEHTYQYHIPIQLVEDKKLH